MIGSDKHSSCRLVSRRVLWCLCTHLSRRSPVLPIPNRPTMDGLSATDFSSPGVCSVVVEPPPQPQPPPPSSASLCQPSPPPLPISTDKNGEAIKLFVGQVPKTFEEKDLEPYLIEFGPIHELTILRDRMNGTHKGKDSHIML